MDSKKSKAGNKSTASNSDNYSGTETNPITKENEKAVYELNNTRPEETNSLGEASMVAPKNSDIASQASSRKLHKHKRHEKTAGEKLFNAITYFGVGWAINAILSVFVADSQKYTHLQPVGKKLSRGLSKTMFSATGAGKVTDEHYIKAEKMFDMLSKELQPSVWKEIKERESGNLEKFYEKIRIEEEHLGKLKDANILRTTSPQEQKKEFELLKQVHKSARKQANLITFIMLNAGGWMILPAMKYLEDHKLEITKKLDSLIDGDRKLSEEEAQKREQGYKEIEEEPKQSWWSMLTSRAVSTVAIVGLYLSIGRRKNVFSFFKKDSFKGTDEIAENLGEKTYNFISQNKLTSKIGESISERLGKTPARLGKKHKADEFNVVDGKERHKNLYGLIFNEVSYAFIMATSVFGFTRIFGNLFHKHDDEYYKEKDSMTGGGRRVNEQEGIETKIEAGSRSGEKNPVKKVIGTVSPFSVTGNQDRYSVLPDPLTISANKDDRGGGITQKLGIGKGNKGIREYMERDNESPLDNSARIDGGSPRYENFTLNGHTVLVPKKEQGSPQNNIIGSNVHRERVSDVVEAGMARGAVAASTGGEASA